MSDFKQFIYFQHNLFKLSKKLGPAPHVHSQPAFGSSRINISLSVKMAQSQLVRQQSSFSQSSSSALSCVNRAQMYLGCKVKHSVQTHRVLANIACVISQIACVIFSSHICRPPTELSSSLWPQINESLWVWIFTLGENKLCRP